MKKDNIHEDEKRRECLIFNQEGGGGERESCERIREKKKEED